MTVLGHIIHPRFLLGITGVGSPFYPSLCTIQDVPTTTNTTGEEVPGAGVDVAGLVDLPCNIAPIGITEQRGADRTVEVGSHRVYMQDYYSTITAMQHAVVDGVTYNILAVEQDSQSAMTVLRVELVS